MKRFFFLLLISIGFYYLYHFLSSHPGANETPPHGKTTAQSKAIPQKKFKANIQADQDQISPETITPSQSKAESLQLITKKFSKVIKQKYSSKEYTQLLEQMGLEIDLKPSSNTSTGTMNMIRTKNNLPGTRYMHAQFFGDEGSEILQHLSFEYQKGENAFQNVITNVSSEFPIKKETQYISEGFISWDIGDDYNLWIKELTREDMENDPFNAYDYDQDIGTIRVAIELKIHD